MENSHCDFISSCNIISCPSLLPFICNTNNLLGLAACTVLFRSNRQSCATYPPVDHELWSRSHVTRAFVEPPSGHSGHTGPKLPKK
jgi:hypothetical protein